MSIQAGKFRHPGNVLDPHASLLRRLRLLAMLGPVVAFGAALAVRISLRFFGRELD